jgi:Na+/H+-translocating membrane pyrophosphatase
MEERMQKKVKLILAGVIICLAIITSIVSAVYLRGRKSTPENQIAVSVNAEDKFISLSDFRLSKVSEDIKNKKGETKHIEGDGVLISDIIGPVSFTEITVISDDEYRASLTSDDMDNAWLLSDEGTARLIVKGDENSKRDVKNVVRIEVK